MAGATRKRENLSRIIPKLWYGWFGRGTSNQFQFTKFFKRVWKKIF